MGGALASRVAFAYSAGEILERVLRMPCFRFVVVVSMGAAVSVAGVDQFCGLHAVSSSGWVFILFCLTCPLLFPGLLVLFFVSLFFCVSLLTFLLA